MSIRIGIYGYGNLGRGVELAIQQNPDMTAVGVFTRRDPNTVKTLTGIPVYAASHVLKMQKNSCVKQFVNMLKELKKNF